MKKSFNGMKAMVDEHQTWLDLVRLLKKTGAVTVRDCQSTLTEKDTDGQKVFDALRKWGAAYAELAVENPKVIKERAEHNA